MTNIILLLISWNLWASDPSIEKYCFSDLSSLQAEAKFDVIRVQSDKVIKEDHCLVIHMSDHRRELIQKYLLSLSGASLAFSSANIKREPCKLRVEKIRKKGLQKTEASVNDGLSVSSTQTNSESTETLMIETLKEFALSVDQDDIDGECRFVNENRYELKIEVKKNARPLAPVQLPAGNIIVVNQAPPPQETMLLKTQIQISRGERIEIGNIVRKLKNDGNKVDIKPELNLEKLAGQDQESVFLSLQ
jgi:hypothetical protein